MKNTDIFPSKYLRAADLGTTEPVVTVKELRMETLGDETKAVLYFAGKEKGLVLNKTNWNTIVEITGRDDSDDWAGKKLKLIVLKVEYQGKRVPAIRIDEPGAAARPVVHEPVTEAPDDSDIPFAWLLPMALPLSGLIAGALAVLA